MGLQAISMKCASLEYNVRVFDQGIYGMWIKDSCPRLLLPSSKSAIFSTETFIHYLTTTERESERISSAAVEIRHVTILFSTMFDHDPHL